MDIYMNTTKDIPVTVSEFKAFTYFDLANFFINWPVCMEDKDDGVIELFTMRYELADTCISNHRFKGIVWYENEAAEVYSCSIPQGELNTLLHAKFSHLFLKQKEGNNNG